MSHVTDDKNVTDGIDDNGDYEGTSEIVRSFCASLLLLFLVPLVKKINLLIIDNDICDMIRYIHFKSSNQDHFPFFVTFKHSYVYRNR